MKSIISTAVLSRKVTLFFACILAVVGLYSYHTVPKQENPDVSAPAAIVTTIYPGASAADINTLVSQKIEDNITDIEGLIILKLLPKRSFKYYSNIRSRS